MRIFMNIRGGKGRQCFGFAPSLGAAGCLGRRFPASRSASLMIAVFVVLRCPAVARRFRAAFASSRTLILLSISNGLWGSSITDRARATPAEQRSRGHGSKVPLRRSQARLSLFAGRTHERRQFSCRSPVESDAPRIPCLESKCSPRHSPPKSEESRALLWTAMGPRCLPDA